MGQEPDAIRDDIEATRRDMSTKLDAIGEKVSPRRIAERRTERVRQSWTGLKDTVMGSAGDTRQSMSGFAGDVGGRASGLADGASDAAGGLTDRVSSAGTSVAEGVRGAPDALARQATGNPLAAGLIAFGAGLLGASLLPKTEAEHLSLIHI